MKKSRYKRDERLSFWRGVIYEFGMIFLIIFINSIGLIFLYNRLLREHRATEEFPLIIISYLLFVCLVASVLVYITRARIYSRNLQMVCRAAQRVAKGDFSVRLDVVEEKLFKNELDILKEDFNKMVDELTSVEMLRDGFVSDVSHEIKTPLSLIQGYADLLESPGISDEKRAEYIKLISVAVRKLTFLVNNILKLNKIENQGIVKRKKFSLDEQLRNCIIAFEDKIDEKAIIINAHLEEINIKNDEALLEIVWNNLLSNAIKFTDYGGEIIVELKKEDGMRIVKISDNGCGMSQKTKEHIFEKFYQGDSSHLSEGNGLGLALVKQVIEKINGEITVESQEGLGSVFTVML